MSEELAILVPPESLADIGDLVLDLVKESSVHSGLSSTPYPRERGTEATDHATLAPKRETLEIHLSDLPGGGAQAIPGRARALLQGLYDLQATVQPVSASTFLYNYGEVLIKRVQPRHGVGDGYSIPVTIEIEEVEYVSQRVDGIPAEFLDPEVAHSAQPRPSEGERSAEEGSDDDKAEAQQEKDAGSLLFRATFGRDT